MYRKWLSILTVTVALGAQTVVAQEPGNLRPIRGGAGGTIIVALPTGELAEQIEAGAGIAFNGQLNLVSSGVLRLRLDGGFIQYGRESREVCFSSTVGCRVRLDLTTENNVVFGGIGPQLMVPTGPLRPYINAGIGFSYFETASHLDGVDDEDDFARTRQFDDGSLAFTGGGGLYIPLRVRDTPISIDLGAQYHRNGVVSYLREGDIQDNPDGSISFTPTRTRADLVTLQLGVSIGFRY